MPVVAMFLSSYKSPPFAVFKISDWIIFIWSSIFVVTFFIISIYILWHWGMTQFKDKNTKKNWFLILFIGSFLYLIGPLLYYILVIELHKGGAKVKDLEQKEAT
jgi:hypothetical protein